jgi:hypothetical protein
VAAGLLEGAPELNLDRSMRGDRDLEGDPGWRTDVRMLMGLVDLSLSRKPLLDGQQNRQVGDDCRDRINYPVEPSSPKVLSAMREILNFVTANLPHSPARILEVGCGTVISPWRLRGRVIH